MSVIDIRGTPVKVNEIRFADDRYGAWPQVCLVTRNLTFGDDASSVLLREKDGEFVRVHGKEHALNLIKALEKSIELGWLD